MLGSLAQPILFLFVFGSGLSSALRGSTGGLGGAGSSLQYVQFIFPGIIGMSVLFTSIFGAMSIVWDREFGFLKEVLVAPIHRSAVAVGKTLGGASQAMIQGLVILVLAPLVGVKLTVVGVDRAGPGDLPVRVRAERARCRRRRADAHDAGLPGGDELPDDADVLPCGRALPAQRQPARVAARC